MPRKSNTRAAQGAGSIRQRPDGRWEARFTVGSDPGTGKPIRRSVYAATQKECRKKLSEITAAIDAGTYKNPCKMSVGEWLDIWSETYLSGCKPRTVAIYKDHIRLHIKPALGAIRLEALNTHTIQQFYNSLLCEHNGRPGLSPKSIKCVHGVLHSALKQAARNDYIRFNPAEACTLPRAEKPAIQPLDEPQIADFLKAIRGHRFEDLFIVTLFTGLRQGEVLGLTWDCVDFERGLLTIDKQMQLHQETGMDAYALVSTKSSKVRTIAAAPFVMAQLRRRKLAQLEHRLAAGPAWVQSDLVFTDERGLHLTKSAVYRAFKKVAASIGRPDARFHDLRHSYAVAAIHSGDDIKTVQSNLGHATAAFTLDVYGHITDKMKQESAARMEQFIQSISG